jgi:CRP-like cAMP-binding protein
MPDAHALFLERLDHAICAMDEAIVALVPHTALLNLFHARPGASFAFWRETLIDAAIFREAITNNSARPLQTRLAHFFCEHYYRVRLAGLVKAGSCSFPLTQTEIGEVVGVSLPSVSRALLALRDTGFVDVRSGRLHIRSWARLAELGEFEPDYLHLRRPKK